MVFKKLLFASFLYQCVVGLRTGELQGREGIFLRDHTEQTNFAVGVRRNGGAAATAAN